MERHIAIDLQTFCKSESSCYLHLKSLPLFRARYTQQQILFRWIARLQNIRDPKPKAFPLSVDGLSLLVRIDHTAPDQFEFKPRTQECKDQYTPQK